MYETYHFEGSQSSDTPRIGTGDLEVGELQRETGDRGVDIALADTHGLWQPKMREDEQSPGFPCQRVRR